MEYRGILIAATAAAEDRTKGHLKKLQSGVNLSLMTTI